MPSPSQTARDGFQYTRPIWKSDYPGAKVAKVANVAKWLELGILAFDGVENEQFHRVFCKVAKIAKLFVFSEVGNLGWQRKLR